MRKILGLVCALLLTVQAFSQVTDSVLTVRANVIRNEPTPGGNTKVRIANMFQDLTNSKVSLLSTYTNPTWLSSLPWSKITSTPTTLSTYGITDAVPSSRTLTINGTTYDLSANRSWTITAGVWGQISGTLSDQTDLGTALGLKVPTSRSLTINGTAYDLSADRSWTISAGVWGSITGTLSSQTDLNTALSGKVATTTTVNGSPLSSNVTVSTITGNAGTATALATARTINGTSFNGTADITVTAAAGTLTGSSLNSTVTSATGLIEDAINDGTTTKAPSENSVFDALFLKLSLRATSEKTTSYTAVAGNFIPTNTTSGTVAITLPTAPDDGTLVSVKMVTQGGSNTTTVTTGGSDVFNKSGGGTTFTLTLLNQGVIFQYKATGAIWYVIADDLSLAQLDLRYANLSSPTFIGTPLAPTATSGTNTTQIATTAFVQQEKSFQLANAQTADYTLVLGDKGYRVEMNKATAIALTVPPNSSVAFDIGTVIYIMRTGAGTLTITQGAGVTVTPTASGLTDPGQYVEMKLVKTGTNTWILQNGTVGAYQDWVTTFTGFSVTPTYVFRYVLEGKTCKYWFTMTVAGTSNGTGFTMTMPYAVKSGLSANIFHTLPVVQNNGTTASTPGRMQLATGSNIATLQRDAAGTAWTGSGGKLAFGSGQYEID